MELMAPWSAIPWWQLAIAVLQAESSHPDCSQASVQTTRNKSQGENELLSTLDQALGTVIPAMTPSLMPALTPNVPTRALQVCRRLRSPVSDCARPGAFKSKHPRAASLCKVGYARDPRWRKRAAPKHVPPSKPVPKRACGCLCKCNMPMSDQRWE